MHLHTIIPNPVKPMSLLPDFITFVRVHQKYGVAHNNILYMKWVKPYAIGYEYVYIPDKVNNLTTERLITLQPKGY